MRIITAATIILASQAQLQDPRILDQKIIDLVKNRICLSETQITIRQSDLCISKLEEIKSDIDKRIEYILMTKD